MKKHAALLTIMALTSTPVLAAQQGGFLDPNQATVNTQKGGFTGPSGSVVTVKQVQDMKDDSWVILRGNIVERVGEDDYTFRDASGSLKVEIDHKRWNGQSVAPGDKVEIQGEVDKESNRIELDVKQLRKIQ